VFKHILEQISQYGADSSAGGLNFNNSLGAKKSKTSIKGQASATSLPTNSSMSSYAMVEQTDEEIFKNVEMMLE
jgi:hypothetical protein